MRFKRKWNTLPMNDTETKEEVINGSDEQIEEKEETKMGFFAKHKKGLIFGGLGALALGAAGLLIAKKGSNEDYDEEYDFEYPDDDLSDDEVVADSSTAED